ncbi:membrane transporter [Schizosaccharomyces octosporus yFS286]|uniref:Membrane transporter n=1 Tax=Schizosaccharomyces octosporus (strain yFS286) TaxID=483514 RepID=S9PZB8_SCHOY|nr:membrane transporter [Schizosaccharomyces octosporus yFS286]EPX73317.1 membrane transporter [Schizosaccharomyces octosporus yFS286]
MSGRDDEHTPLLISDPSVNRAYRSRTPSPEREYCSSCPLISRSSTDNDNGASSTIGNTATSNSKVNSTSQSSSSHRSYNATVNNEPVSFNDPENQNQVFRDEGCGRTDCCMDTTSRPKKRLISPLLILPLNFINAFSWAMIEIPLLFLIRQGLCAKHYGLDPSKLAPGDAICRLPEITSGVSKYRAAFGSVAAFLGLLSTACYGTLGDIYGRRLVLMIAVSFVLFGDMFLLYQSYSFSQLSFILLSACLKGLGGYISTILAGQNSYVADCTQNEHRAWYLALNFATYHVGTALGPTISGYILQCSSRMYYVFIITTMLWTFYILYVWLILPESLNRSEDNVESTRLSFSSVIDTCLGPLKVLWPQVVCTEESCSIRQYDVNCDTHAGRRHWDVMLAAVLIFLALIGAGAMALLPIYTDFYFGWGPLKASLILFTDSFASAFTLVAIFPLVSKIIERVLETLHSSKGLFNYLSSRTDNPSTLEGIRNVFSYLTLPGYTNESVLRANTLNEMYTIVKRDVWNTRFSYIVAICSSVLLARAQTDVSLFIAVIVQAVSNMVIPCVQSIALNGVLSEYNGRILAAFAVFEAAALIIRGPMYAYIYAASVDTSFPNLIFYVSAFLYVICLVVTYFMRLYKPLNRT